MVLDKLEFITVLSRHSMKYCVTVVQARAMIAQAMVFATSRVRDCYMPMSLDTITARLYHIIDMNVQ